MDVVNLDNLEGLPEEFIRELEMSKSVFSEIPYLDELINRPTISNIVNLIDEFCRSKKVIGYHYTRAIPNIIKESGLTCRTGSEIRKEFLVNHGGKFSEDELHTILHAWNEYFDEGQQSSRDSRLFFNFTTKALGDTSAEPLFNSFGGEQVFMPIQYIKSIGKKLSNIGRPFILKCTLDPNQIETYCRIPWGTIAVSTFHCKVNGNAMRYDQDGHQGVNVNAEDIEIIEYKTQRHSR